MTDERRRSLVQLSVFGFCLLVLLGSAAAAIVLVRGEQTSTRGVTYRARDAVPAAIGVNVALDQYSNEADLRRALGLVRDSQIHLARQHFYWNAIEPSQDEFQWQPWDRIVELAGEYGIELTAVLDTTPPWARDPGEADLVNAPPANVADYARFVSAFVQHYDGRIRRIELWDNPNVHPFWGRRNADPIQYAALLRAGATASRAVDPAVTIISAGLAPNAELIRGHPDYSDVLFLRGIYDAGARDYFDVLGAKPYGMWSGADDRRVDMDVFNFSRAILLHEEMIAHDDANKPVWAVEFGWNALPADWQGAPSPWGTDAEQVQSARLTGAIERARSEWPWMTALIAQTLQPNAPGDDPVRGFALVDKEFRPRALAAGIANGMAAPIQPAAFDFIRFYLLLAALGIVAATSAWRGAVAGSHLAWAAAWGAIQAHFRALPSTAQFALLSLGALALYYSPSTALNVALVVLLVMLFALRLEYGLTITVFAIPFYLLPKTLVGTLQFSMVELFTLACVAAWIVGQVTRRSPRNDAETPIAVSAARTDEDALRRAGPEAAPLARPAMHVTRSRSRFAVRVGSRTVSLLTCDLAIVLFVLAGLLSVKMADNFGVANREFRVAVFEPALLYGLIRAQSLSRPDLKRLVDAFVLSTVAVSAIGIYQYLLTSWVIVGEGVRRVLAVYGSPNNLALYLDRGLPLVLALALFSERGAQAGEAAASDGGTRSQTGNAVVRRAWRRVATPRVLYTIAAVPIAVGLYLTYSRGSLLLGVPAGLLFIGLVSGRRVRLAVAAVAVIGVLALVPFSQTVRFQSLFQEGTGTGFFRVSVWKSGAEMIRDNPVFGVGLDNFLYQYPKYIQPDAWREPNLSHPHNIVLDFWVRLGILGVVVLAWTTFEFYRAGFSQLGGSDRAVVLGLMASMTAALAHGMIDAGYFYVDLAFVFMLTYAVVVELKSSAIPASPP